MGQPTLVLVTGLQGTGKSTVADLVARQFSAPLLAHDWLMSGLRSFPEIQATLDAMDPPGHGVVGWSMLFALAQSHLARGSSVVLDGVARAPQIGAARRLAAETGSRCSVIMTECSDLELHRTRIEGRERDIPGWYELEWSHVERARINWDPTMTVDLKVDSVESLTAIGELLQTHVDALT